MTDQPQRPWQCERIDDIATQRADLKNLKDFVNRVEKRLTTMEKKKNNDKKGFGISHAVIITLLGLVANLVFLIVQRQSGGAPPLP